MAGGKSRKSSKLNRLTMITKDEFDGYEFYYAGHGNMGYQVDEQGHYTDRHKGYSYCWKCEDNPRLMFWERHYMLDDAGIERDWYIDGEKVATASPWNATPMDKLLPLLAKPPTFTMLEVYCLLRMERLHLAFFAMVDAVAGCEQPTAGFIDSTEVPLHRWTLVYHTMEGLRAKGAISTDMGMTRRSVAI